MHFRKNSNDCPLNKKQRLNQTTQSEASNLNINNIMNNVTYNNYAQNIHNRIQVNQLDASAYHGFNNFHNYLTLNNSIYH